MAEMVAGSGFPELDPQQISGLGGSPLRRRDFGLLFARQSVSVFGDRLVMVAMPFAVLTIPGAGLSSVGLVLGASALSLAVLGLIPQLVEPDQLQPANALLGLSSNLAMVVGPGVAGALVGGFGAGVAIAIDAATFLISGLTLMFLRPAALSRATRDERPRFLSDLVQGWREVRS